MEVEIIGEVVCLYCLTVVYGPIFYVCTPSGLHLFDHLLWPIFQSSIIFYNYNFFKLLHVHGNLMWAAFV